MARAFYASKISENISETPQDYLICKNVPISRTGGQEYYGEECGFEELRGQKIQVNRAEADVFEPAALASFEGMPVTDGHPKEEVTAENFRGYFMGVVRDVRRGDGEDSDKAVANLIIYDKSLADGIRGGKREISCGYTCLYETDEDGSVYQRHIRGNHVAVVPAGRAGNAVAIRDSKPAQTVTQTERRNRNMSKTKGRLSKSSIFSGLFPLIAKDADPGELADALETIEEAVTESAPPAHADEAPAPPTPKDEAPPSADEEMPPWGKMLMEQLSQIQARIQALGEARDEDPLGKLEDELAGGEAAVSKPPDQIDEDPETTDEDPASTDDPSPAADDDIDPAQDEDTTASATSDSLLKFVRTMKPVIAEIKDSKAKKRVSDSLANAVRQMNGQPKTGGRNGYAGILDARADNGRKRAADRGADMPIDLNKLQSTYDSLNPHKKGAK